jgi:hypothetical protein
MGKVNQMSNGAAPQPSTDRVDPIDQDLGQVGLGGSRAAYPPSRPAPQVSETYVSLLVQQSYSRCNGNPRLGRWFWREDLAGRPCVWPTDPLMVSYRLSMGLQASTTPINTPMGLVLTHTHNS